MQEHRSSFVTATRSYPKQFLNPDVSHRHWPLTVLSCGRWRTWLKIQRRAPHRSPRAGAVMAPARRWPGGASPVFNESMPAACAVAASRAAQATRVPRPAPAARVAASRARRAALRLAVRVTVPRPTPAARVPQCSRTPRGAGCACAAPPWQWRRAAAQSR
jgi:hypothetical protein